jgi:hypothetical protein
MVGDGGSREASGGDGRDDVQGDEDAIMGAQDSVPIPPSLAQEVSASSSLTTTSLAIRLAPQNSPGLQQHHSAVVN